MVGRAGGDIGRRIVEGEVPVLADPDQPDIDGAGPQQPGQAPAFALRIRGIGSDVGERCQAGHAADEALAQIAAEAGRMAVGDADVLIEVEGVDPLPGDIRAGDQHVQGGILAGAGRDHQGGPAATLQGLAEEGGGAGPGTAAEFGGIGGDVDVHGVDATAVVA